MKPTKTDEVLLKMLREKQERLGIYYLKTDGGLYKSLAVIFYIALAICTLMNILFVLSNSLNLAAHLSNLDSPSNLQSTEISAIKNSLYTVSAFGILLIPSFIFQKKQKSILHLIFTLLPCAVLLVTFYQSMSDNIATGVYAPFIFKHLLPILLLVFCCIINSVIELRQRYLDKKGTEEIACSIYAKYSSLADNITEEQWLEILKEYQRPVKDKKRKKKEKEKTTTEV